MDFPLESAKLALQVSGGGAAEAVRCLLVLHPKGEAGTSAALRLSKVIERSVAKMADVHEKLRAKIDAQISSAGGRATAAPRFKRLKDSFELLSGSKVLLTRLDLGQLTESLGVRLGSEELSEAMSSLDSDGDGCISFGEFLDFWGDREMAALHAAQEAARRGSESRSSGSGYAWRSAPEPEWASATRPAHALASGSGASSSVRRRLCGVDAGTKTTSISATLLLPPAYTARSTGPRTEAHLGRRPTMMSDEVLVARRRSSTNAAVQSPPAAATLLRSSYNEAMDEAMASLLTPTVASSLTTTPVRPPQSMSDVVTTRWRSRGLRPNFGRRKCIPAPPPLAATRRT